jgi:uncharacterized protein YaiE (UPF0345 family)
MSNRARLSVEALEDRLVPAAVALIYTWSPTDGTNDGGNSKNWLCGGARGAIPTAADTVNFDPTVAKGNTNCASKLTSYVALTTANGYTATISQAASDPMTFGSAYTASGTLNTGNQPVTITTGRLGTINGAGWVFNVTGSGELDVNAGASVTLDNVNLNASVRVASGGTVTVGRLTFGNADPQRWFIVQGTAEFQNTLGGAAGSFTSSMQTGAKYQYYQPIIVQNNTGSLYFNNNYKVKGFIFNQGGSVYIENDVLLTVDGDSGNATGTPTGIATAYLGDDGNSNLYLSAATLTEADTTSNRTVYDQTNNKLIVDGPTGATIVGSVDLEGAQGSLALLQFGAGAGSSDYNLTIQSGDLTLNLSKVIENLTYGTANGTTLTTINSITCKALATTNSTFVLVATNPNDPIAFTNLAAITDTARGLRLPASRREYEQQMGRE